MVDVSGSGEVKKIRQGGGTDLVISCALNSVTCDDHEIGE
jgi:hypothetical protein